MNQTIKANEIILLDNASTNGSLDIARQFPSVRLMPLIENTGFARGNNLAIDAASQESIWIALLNPDAFAEPSWLDELLAATRRNPAFDVFGSKLVNPVDPTVLDGAGDGYHMSGLAWRMGHGMPVPAVAEDEREVFRPCAVAALYRRSALCKLGGFDEDYFCYIEGVDLGFCLRLAGYRCLYVPQSVAHHVGSGTSGRQDSDFTMYHGHRNLVWIFAKDMPGILFWGLLPLHVALNLMNLIWFALRWRRGGVIWKANRDALAGLPKMWHKSVNIFRKIALP